MSPNSMDRFAPPDSTRVSSSSPSSTSSSFDSTVLNSTVPFSLFGNEYQPHHNAAWSFDDSSSSSSHNNNTSIAYSGGLFGSPHAATQQAVEAAVHQCPSPPLVQMHNLSLSSSPIYAPCGPVTYVSTSGLVAPRPVSSSPPLIGCGWSAPFQPPPVLANAFTSEPPAQGPPALPPRPPMQAKIPPEKGRKSFPCLHPGCGMKFPKRNALVQHMRSHTGERPEVCDWCSRAFSLKCNLRRHYRTCKKKKALEAAARAAKEEPSSSPPPPFEQSPSPGASSPSTTVVPTSHDSPPAEMFAPPHNLWDPSFNFTPSHQASTLAADMNCQASLPSSIPDCLSVLHSHSASILFSISYLPPPLPPSPRHSSPTSFGSSPFPF